MKKLNSHTKLHLFLFTEFFCLICMFIIDVGILECSFAPLIIFYTIAYLPIMSLIYSVIAYKQFKRVIFPTVIYSIYGFVSIFIMFAFSLPREDYTVLIPFVLLFVLLISILIILIILIFHKIASKHSATKQKSRTK